jgi:hypothetical protein
MAGRRSRTEAQGDRVAAAAHKIASLQHDLEELEADATEDITEITRRGWRRPPPSPR